MADHKSGGDQTVKYEPIDEKTFIQRFVTPYASYMRYDNGKYWYKNDIIKYHPVFDFSISADVDSKACSDSSEIQRVPDWEDYNQSLLIALDGQVHGELGHYLYVGFSHLHAGRTFLYPVGPVGINYRGEAFPGVAIDTGIDNCIPIPLQIKHYYSDGLYASNGFRVMHYHNGVLQKRESTNGRFWYYKGGQLCKCEDRNGEITFESGFIKNMVRFWSADAKEIMIVNDFHRGERHGDMVYENCHARLDNGYLYGPFRYESADWQKSTFPPPHKGKLEGRVSVIGNFRPGMVKVSYNNSWDCYCGKSDDYTIGFVERENNVTLSPHDCIGPLKLSINGIERASFYLNADGQFHGPQQPWYRVWFDYYWNGTKCTCDTYNKMISEMMDYTSLPRELIDIIVLYS